MADIVFHKQYLPSVASTNSYLTDRMREGAELAEGTVVYTLRQFAGKGQVGNKWESEFDKNISFSVLLRPTSLPVKQQFYISEAISLAVAKTLEVYIGKDNVSIKWPNDVYVGDGKICGILIENTLAGSRIESCVVGVGININQTLWVVDAPNPTSLKLCTGKDFGIEEVLEAALGNFSIFYSMICEGRKEELHALYNAALYRRDRFNTYIDAESGERFQARIKDVEPTGHLVLEADDGSLRRYMFKEVKFVLPCGIIKE